MLNFSALISTLPLMAAGIGGVFAVIILVWLSIAALTKFCK